MAKLKFLTWNVEWMNDLFTAGTGPAAFRPDGGAKGFSKPTNGANGGKKQTPIARKSSPRLHKSA